MSSPQHTALHADWPAVLAAGAAQVGGKAHTLAQLAVLGFKVPPGMALGVQAWQAWLDDTGLRQELLAACQLPDAQRQPALSALHARLLATPPSAALQAALAQALANPTLAGQPLAVRSSSPQEDSATASFAGIHHSVLQVRSSEALGKALVAVWASIWTPTAAAYRQRLGLAHEAASMAVLIMPMVAARASGIAFTQDPATGRDDRLIIHANWGLGESLVGGQVQGDEITLAEPNPLDNRLALHSYQPGSKARATRVGVNGELQLQTLGSAEAQQRVLTEPQALALGQQARLAALALDFANAAFDCEWAWDGQHFWLLQARPITASARCTYAALQYQPDLWSRGNIKDVMPHPLYPVEWWGVRPLIDLLMQAGAGLAGHPQHPGLRRGKLIHGHAYLNMAALQFEAYEAFNLPPAVMNQMIGGTQPTITVPEANAAHRWRTLRNMGRYALRVRRMQRLGEAQAGQAVPAATQLRAQWAQPVADEPAAQTAQRLRPQLGLGVAQKGLHFLQGSGGAYFSMLVKLIDQHLPGQGQALAAALLAGGTPSVTAQQAFDLVRLAQLAQADPQASAWLQARTTQPPAQRDDWAAALPTSNPFRLAMDAFIERYGHRAVAESYLRTPRWREAPAYLLDSLPGLAGTDLPAMAQRQANQVTQALATLQNAVPRWKRGWLRVLIQRAHQEANNREAARSALMAYLDLNRCALLAVGQGWVRQGALQSPEQIFWLLHPEVLATLEGERPTNALLPLVRARQARHAQALANPPELIVQGPALQSTPQPAAPTAPPALGAVLKGVAVGGGVVTGRARLLSSPDQGHGLSAGDILVAPSTDPAWTPLFLQVGDLVMETGGALSHGAIVAREFGIPAVVNVAGAMTLIREGELLQVNGRLGTVTRCDA
jgi:pyruvate,water dikinase